MTDVQRTIDRIDAVLAECDAAQLPPLVAAFDPAGDLGGLVIVDRATRRLVHPTSPAIDMAEAWRQLGYAPPARRRPGRVLALLLGRRRGGRP